MNIQIIICEYMHTHTHINASVLVYVFYVYAIWVCWRTYVWVDLLCAEPPFLRIQPTFVRIFRSVYVLLWVCVFVYMPNDKILVYPARAARILTPKIHAQAHITKASGHIGICSTPNIHTHTDADTQTPYPCAHCSVLSILIQRIFCCYRHRSYDTFYNTAAVIVTTTAILQNSSSSVAVWIQFYKARILIETNTNMAVPIFAEGKFYSMQSSSHEWMKTKSEKKGKRTSGREEGEGVRRLALKMRIK